MAHNREKPLRTAKNNFARSQRGAAGCSPYLFQQRERGKGEVSKCSVWDRESPFNYRVCLLNFNKLLRKTVNDPLQQFQREKWNSTLENSVDAKPKKFQNENTFAKSGFKVLLQDFCFRSFLKWNIWICEWKCVNIEILSRWRIWKRTFSVRWYGMTSPLWLMRN